MIWILLACTDQKQQEQVVENLDLTERLSETEVRAGIIHQETSLFGGTAAEGQLGDIKIYNNRVQFVIQSDRPSSYYMEEGCGLLDADIIRPEGAMGRDIIDEYSPMAGLGNVLACDSIEVLDDGSSGVAHVQVKGHQAPFLLLEGALESWDFITDVDLEFVVDYRLEPDSNLLEVETQISWNDEQAGYFQLANVLLLGKEVLQTWNPGGGFDGNSNLDWFGTIGKENEIALALLPKDNFAESSLQSLLADATPAMASFTEAYALEKGDVIQSTQYIGVGQGLSMITDQWYEKQAIETIEYSGTVTANGNPVAGARVNLYDENDEALTLAITEADGSWKANLPTDKNVNFVVTGRGEGLQYDLPTGAGWYSLYTVPAVEEQVLNSFSQGAVENLFAEGYGVGEINAQELIAPGILSVNTQDGKPAIIEVHFADGDPQPSSRWVPSRPGGKASHGFSVDGQMDLRLEPGDYRVIVHRGADCEYAEEFVTISSGATQTITPALRCIELPENVISFDPHNHSSPSGDGKISMAKRILTHAGHGIDVHVSTEHDHIADFTPIIASLGLSDNIETIVGAEVSPPIKGHINAYPLQPQKEEINFGAPRWWLGPETTQALFDRIQERLEEPGVLQANHPVGAGGFLSAANYDIYSGTIQDPYYWSEDFIAMELINGSYQEYLPYYFDLVSRGKKVTPVSVSDSHTYASGVGQERTYAYAGSASDIIIAVRNQRTVASQGVYIHPTINGDFAPGNIFVGTQELQVELYGPSWIHTDTVQLMENGILIDEKEYLGEALFFDIAPSADSHYSVIASSEQSMAPVYNRKPWAMSAAFFIDLEGDGWTSPLSRYE